MSEAPSTKFIVSSIFKTGSTELTKYLNDCRVGNTIASPDSTQLWTIMSVDQVTDLPPDPLGNSVVQVNLTVSTVPLTPAH